MANSILKLKVETSEYDQKLANAAKGIRHLADVAHKGGGELTGLEKAELDYIKALGDMETKSRSASGQVRELSSTYKELKVIYDQLNEVEKADEGGKALAASLETLRTRAQEAKTQLDSATQSLQSNGEAGKGTSGILEVLKDKFTINIDALTLFNKGLQVAEVALNVAKDAFFASEATVDEWGRIVDSSKSLYEGFLTALNTGDISGYLGRIDEIVQAARTAYNELDRLGTMKTIQAPKMSAQQTENERMRMMIQTGRYIAPVDGRRASMQNGQLLTPDQIKRIEQQLQGGMQKVVTLVGNEVAQTGRAIDAVYNRQAQELGLSLKEFRKGTSSMAEFDKRMAGYEQYQKWREQHTTIDMQSGREIIARGNPFEQFAKWGTFRVDGQRYNDLVRLIQQRDQQAAQAYGMQSQAYRTMNRAEGVTVSKLMRGETTVGATVGGGKGGKTITEEKDDFVEINGLINMAAERVSDLQRRIREAPSESMITELRDQLKDAQAELDRLNGKEVKIQMETGTSITNDAGMSGYIASIKQQLETADYGTSLYNGLSAQLADMTALKNLVGASLKAGLGTAMFDAADATGKDFWTRAMEGGVEDTDWQAIVDKINEKLKEMKLDPITINFKTGETKSQSKEMSKDWREAASAIQAVGSAMSQIEDPAAKVVGTIAQAIASIALGFAQATAVDSKFGVFGWIAAVTTGLATMISTISTIHSATGYANGGVVKAANGAAIPGTFTVPGNTYSGDQIPAMLNAGETVLTRAQSGIIASALEGGGLQRLQLSATIHGEDIRLALNNNSRRTGHGEYVTTTFR